MQASAVFAKYYVDDACRMQASNAVLLLQNVIGFHLKCRTKCSNLKTPFFDYRSVLRCKAVLAVFKLAERSMGNVHKDRGFHCSVLNEGSSFLWHCQWQIL